MLIIGVVCGVFVLLNTITVDGYICVLVRHHYHFHCGDRKHAHTPDIHIHPAKSVESVESGVELRLATPEGDGDVEEEETPEEKQKEDRYIDALLFVVPTVLIFGLYTAYRAEYYQNFNSIYDKTYCKGLVHT